MSKFPPSNTSGGRRPPEPPIVLVPGHHFFTEVAPLAPGTPASEVGTRAALVLEGCAPFPPEQLAHGHYAPAGANGVLVFAALKRKFAADQERWKAAAFVIPDFVTWLPCGRAQAEVVVLETDAAVTALEYAAGSPLPRRIVSRPVAAEPGGTDGVERARQLVLDRIGPAGRHVLRYRLGATPCVQDGSRYHFHWEPVEKAPAAPGAMLGAAQLWALDVREPDFLRERRREFQWNKRGWNAVIAVGYAAVLLALGEAALLTGWFLHKQRSARVEAQMPAAQTAQHNRDVANRLSAFLDRKPQPLEMLAYINNLRPRSISFPKVSIEGATKVVAEGLTQNSADVNEFEAALRKAPAIASAEAKGGVLRSEGGTTFQLTVTFRPGFDPGRKAAPVAPAAGQPVAPQTVPVQP